jgi:rhodanese-related sulfurtransferase
MKRTFSMKYLFFILLITANICMLDLNPAYGGLSMTWDSVKQMIQEKFPDDPKISTTDLSALLLLPENQQPLILDAREKKEYVVSHIYGARIARNKKEAFKILNEEGRDRLIVVYCSVGYRSAVLVNKLRKKGFTNAYNLEGSIFKWRNEGHTVYSGNQEVKLVHPFNREWGELLDKQFWYSEKE